MAIYTLPKSQAVADAQSSRVKQRESELKKIARRNKIAVAKALGKNTSRQKPGPVFVSKKDKQKTCYGQDGRPIYRVGMQSTDFYRCREWLELRYNVLVKYGRKCLACGNAGIMHVDHILPRSLHPQLELQFDNLQVLCENCNIGKSNKDSTDWRNQNAGP